MGIQCIVICLVLYKHVLFNPPKLGYFITGCQISGPSLHWTLTQGGICGEIQNDPHVLQVLPSRVVHRTYDIGCSRKATSMSALDHTHLSQSAHPREFQNRIKFQYSTQQLREIDT